MIYNSSVQCRHDLYLIAACVEFARTIERKRLMLFPKREFTEMLNFFRCDLTAGYAKLPYCTGKPHGLSLFFQIMLRRVAAIWFRSCLFVSRLFLAAVRASFKRATWTPTVRRNCARLCPVRASLPVNSGFRRLFSET